MKNKKKSIHHHEFMNFRSFLNFNYFYLFLLISAFLYSLPVSLMAQQSNKTLNKMNCSFNQLIELPELPKNLTYLNCSNNPGYSKNFNDDGKTI